MFKSEFKNDPTVLKKNQKGKNNQQNLIIYI
jgi:hypothetical protein